MSTGTLARRWLSQQEAADYLGVTDRSIRAYIARGDLPARRVRGSRLIRIDRQDVDLLLRPIATVGGAVDVASRA